MSVHPWAAAGVTASKERILKSHNFSNAEIIVLSVLAHSLEQGTKNLSQYGASEVAGAAALLGGVVAAGHEIKDRLTQPKVASNAEAPIQA